MTDAALDSASGPAGAPPSITGLPALVERLSQADRDRFHRIFTASSVDAVLRVPPAMEPWVERQFPDVGAVESQRIVRVVNRVTGEGALFNPLRAQRPQQAEAGSIPPGSGLLPDDDLLARPLDNTPEDPFGRLRNDHGVTAANVAKFDALHAMVVFEEADPLAFTRESLAAHLDLALRWVQAANEWDPQARYPYILWNCLWRAGGSLVHGHLQVVLGRGAHYARIERLRQDAQAYQERHGVSYFDDFALVHLALGCGHRVGEASVLASLTPIREKEVVVLAPRLGEDAVSAIHQVLTAFRDRLSVASFNVGVLLPPVAPVDESWDGFPVVVRLVDRGPLGSRTSDVGGMELFAESVVSSDPFAVARAIAPSAGGG